MTDETERPIRSPMALGILGRAIAKRGVKEGDLALLRLGREAQARARAASSPNRPREEPPRQETRPPRLLPLLKPTLPVSPRLRAGLVALTTEDDVVLDLRYASADNLLGRPVYSRAVALLRPQAHGALLRAAARARALGLRLKVFDAFRPLEAQWAFHEAAPDKRYVADPRLGGTHPRGIAVDLTLVDRSTGADLAMGTGFDAFEPASAHAALDGLPLDAILNRALLLGIMTAAGFEHYAPEWWHYHLPGRDAFPALAAADVPGGPM